MRAPPLLLVLAAASLAGCVSTPGPASFERTSPRDFQILAACAYGQLDRIYPTKIRLADLKGAGQVRISMEESATGLVSSSTTRVFDMTIEKVGPGSRVTIASMPTIHGPNFYADRTWREIASCT